MLENKIWVPINQYTSKHKLIEQGDGIVIGLSGGADSICLARYLLYLRESMQLKLLAVHVNHMLRPGEADRDQSFVEEYADEGSVTLYLNGANTDLWVSEADPEYDSFYLSIDYENSDWSGRVSFDFWEGALEGYRMINQR